MVDQSVIDSIQSYFIACRNRDIEISFGVLFGSQATGTANEWSDIDLIVVSPRFDKQRTQQDLDVLWETAGVVDSRIQPIPCGEWRWEHDDGSPILEIARREGIRIEPKQVITA